jgi:hypothetical protein
MRVFLLPTPPKAREIHVQIEKFGNISPLRFGAGLTLVVPRCVVGQDTFKDKNGQSTTYHHGYTECSAPQEEDESGMAATASCAHKPLVAFTTQYQVGQQLSVRVVTAH